MTEQKIRHNVTCRSCGVRYETYIQPFVGKPCPNPKCPVGNPILSSVETLRKIKGLTTAVGLSLSASVIAYLAGWSTLVSGLAISVLAHLFIALLIFGFILAGIQKITSRFLPKNVIKTLLILMIVLTLPLITVLFNRPIEYFEIFQTVSLAILSNWISNWLIKTERARPPTG